jgi:hypothetical protein
MFPPVLNYGDIDAESFDEYYARWPAELGGIPRGVVQDWIHRHWDDFRRHWTKLEPHRWVFELISFSNDQVLSIDHIGAWIQELDAEGVEFVTNKPRSRTRLAQFMLEHGTFPVPIIVAHHAGHVIHPRSGGERMKVPYQLIEGHTRLACIRGMINSDYPRLAERHDVWLVRIPEEQRRRRGRHDA